MTPLRWNLADPIREAAREAGGYSKLAKRINAAADASQFANLCKPVDRRKLAGIVDGKGITISTGELLALDNFFAPNGEGLADLPLFARQSLLQNAVENNRCDALIGAFERSEEERNDISLWDVKAYQEICEGMFRFREGMRIPIQDVPLFQEVGKRYQRAPVIDRLLEGPRTSICSIGSPRSNFATEQILSEMFGLEPYVPGQKPPFQFFWPGRGFASAFAADPKDVLPHLPQQRPGTGGRSICAIRVDDEIYSVVPAKNTTWEDYGIIAAQRLSGNRIRIVLAGLTGPSTYACAIACRSILNESLPEPTGAVWVLVKAVISPGRQGIGDTRSIARLKLVNEPQRLPSSPPNGAT